jgi:hypothetical protein
MKTVTATVLKAEALHASGTLNRRPERVTDPLFRGHSFFDARDLVQVKYEMLRRVEREQVGVQMAATTFGFSRVAWYQVKARYDRDGLVGLLPQRRGPKLHPQKQRWRWARSGALNCSSSMSCFGNRRSSQTGRGMAGGW